jgi:hypothetical protein
MTESIPADNLSLSFDVLGGLRDVYYHGHFQGRSTARAFLSGSHASMFSLQVDLRRHSVCAHGTVGQAMSMFFSQSFHIHFLLISSDATE